MPPSATCRTWRRGCAARRAPARSCSTRRPSTTWRTSRTPSRWGRSACAASSTRWRRSASGRLKPSDFPRHFLHVGFVPVQAESLLVPLFRFLLERKLVVVRTVHVVEGHLRRLHLHRITALFLAALCYTPTRNRCST